MPATILGRILAKVTRKSFEKNVQERIFEPLGLKSSGYDRNQTILEKRASGYTRGPFEYTNADFINMDSSPGAAGSLYSTVEDMFLWDQSLYTDKLLNRKYRDLMLTPNRNIPEVKAAGGRPQSRYGYGWQIYSRTHPVTKRRTKVINHGGAINGFRAMENRLVDDNAFIIVLCNQGDSPGGSEVWNSVVNLSTELIHVVTDQPYKLPGQPRMTQDQRMYEMIERDGIDTAIAWFTEKGRKAAWGGTNMTLAQQLIKEGSIDDGLRLMEFEVELAPGKVWLVRKLAETYLNAGRAEEALATAKQGIDLKPEDEKLANIQVEAEHDLKGEGE